MRVTAARALTLIELLAVVALLAIAGSVGLVGLAGADGEAKLQRALSDWRMLDCLARAAGMNGEKNVVILVADRRIDLKSSDGTLAQRTLARGISLEISIGSAGSGHLSFDERGCSDDYRLTVSAESRSLTLQFCGETGAIIDVQKEMRP
jgi:prepilin-type N-terminal cleavage/methylation domain-containing protein